MDVQLPDGTTVQGVPDGTTRQQLAQKLKASGRDVPQGWLGPQPKPGPGAAAQEGGAIPSQFGGGAGEVFPAMASSMVAGPVSDIAGLADIPLHAMGLSKTMPQDVKSSVQRALTYEPRSAAGKAATEAVGMPFLALESGAKMAERAVAPSESAGPVRSAVGSAVRGAIEQAPALLGAKAGKAAEAGIPAKAAELKLRAGENLPKDTVRNLAQEAGYKTPPEHGVQAALSGLAGKTKTEKILSTHNEENATRRLGSEVGVPEGQALTPEEFDRLKADTGQAYDAVAEAAGPELDVTNKFSGSLRSTLDRLESLTDQQGLAPAKRVLRSFIKKITPPEQAPVMKDIPPVMKTIAKTAQEQPGLPISRTLEQAAGAAPYHFGIEAPPAMPVPTAGSATLSTAQAIKDISSLRRRAKSDFANRNNELGTARLGVANELENLIEDNLAKTGKQDLVSQFRDARKRFAKIYLLERVTNDATGKVSLPKLASLSDTAAYKGILDGEFKLAADFSKTFRKAAQKGTGEAAPRLTVFDGMFGIGSIIAGHPVAGAVELGGRLGIPALAERGLLQNRTPSYIPQDRLRQMLPYLGTALSQSGQIQPPPQ